MVLSFYFLKLVSQKYYFLKSILAAPRSQPSNTLCGRGWCWNGHL